MPKVKEKSALETAEEQRDAIEIMEKLTVIAQPHRRGDRGYMTDSFGTFLQRQFGDQERDLMRRCWEAGQSYILKVARWRRAKGIPQRDLLEDETPSGGGELDAGTVASWGEEIRQCENAMKCSGLSGFQKAQALVLEDAPPPVNLYGPVKRAVIQLAICLGLFTEGKRK